MLTKSEAHLRATIAAHESWANTPNRSVRTAPARAAFDQKFLDAAGGDPERAAHLRKAHFARLALKSAQARRKGGGARASGDPNPPSSTARPAEKGADQEVSPAAIRRCTTALVELAAAAGVTLRRADARAQVAAWFSTGRSESDIMRGARNLWGVVDETGETVAHNLDRGRTSLSASGGGVR